HEIWDWPLTWPGAEHPKLGPGKPSLIFVCGMSELFHERRSAKDIERVVRAVALSDHIGLLLTKRPQQMAAFFAAQSPRTIHNWQDNIWLGFSAESEAWFDERWDHVRPLAQAGWRTFVSIAPMIGPVTLPSDFLALSTWVIVGG